MEKEEERNKNRMIEFYNVFGREPIRHAQNIIERDAQMILPFREDIENDAIGQVYMPFFGKDYYERRVE